MDMSSTFNNAVSNQTQSSDAQNVTINKLQQAILKQELGTVKQIIDSGLDLNDPVQSGLNPLTYALMTNAYQSADLLLDQGIKPDDAYLHAVGLTYVKPLDYLLSKIPPSPETCEAMLLAAVAKRNRTMLYALEERKLLDHLSAKEKVTDLLQNMGRAPQDIKDLALSLLVKARDRQREEKHADITARHAEKIIAKATAKSTIRIRHRHKRTP